MGKGNKNIFKIRTSKERIKKKEKKGKKTNKGMQWIMSFGRFYTNEKEKGKEEKRRDKYILHLLLLKGSHKKTKKKSQ